MSIKLLYPDGTVARLYWQSDHPTSHHGIGVVRFSRPPNEILDGWRFLDLIQQGCEIVCGDSRDVRRVCSALAWSLGEIPHDKIKTRTEEDTTGP